MIQLDSMQPESKSGGRSQTRQWAHIKDKFCPNTGPAVYKRLIHICLTQVVNSFPAFKKKHVGTAGYFSCKKFYKKFI